MLFFIAHFCNKSSRFNFSWIYKNTVLKEIRFLSNTKTSQDTDLPVKVLQENADYFAEFICTQLNDSAHPSQFPSSFKCANVTPSFRKEPRDHKNNCRPIYHRIYSFKDFWKIMKENFQFISKTFYQNFSTVFEKFQYPTLSPFDAWKIEKCSWWQ